MSDADFSVEGVDVGNPAGFLVSYAQEGASARSALNAFREAGGSMGNEVFRSLYAQVRDSLGRIAEAGSINYDALPDAAQYGEWAMGRGGQYATQVELTVVDRVTGITGTTKYTYVSDTAHTPGEAVAEAMDVFGDVDAESDYEQRVTGGFVTAMWQTVPWPR